MCEYELFTSLSAAAVLLNSPTYPENQNFITNIFWSLSRTQSDIFNHQSELKSQHVYFLPLLCVFMCSFHVLKLRRCERSKKLFPYCKSILDKVSYPISPFLAVFYAWWHIIAFPLCWPPFVLLGMIYLLGIFVEVLHQNRERFLFFLLELECIICN